MSLLVKIGRNLAYTNHKCKSLALNSILRLPKCNRKFHCSSLISSKMYMEHENQYAYNILENKGYAVSFNTTIESRKLTEDEFKKMLEKDWSKHSPGEIFQAFSTFAKYSFEHNIFISDTMFDNFVDHLTDSIRFASDKELESLFYALNQWPEPASMRTRNHIEVWVALDDECLNSCREWTYDELLTFTALFYMLNVIRRSDFCAKSLNKLASKAKHLTPGQLTQTLFYVGLWRTSPFDMHNLEVHLNNNYSEFSVDDLAIMSMGFFKSKTPLRDPTLVLKIINSVIENAKDIHEVSLAALLKIIRYSTRVTPDDRIHRLLETLQHEVTRLSIMCNVHIALLGTSTLNCHVGCFNKIAETVLHSMSSTRLKDLERLVLTYGTFNLVPQTKECFFTKVLDELRKPERIPEINQYGRTFACCLSYLTLLNLYPEDLISRALSKEFLDITYGKNYYYYGREILTLHHTAEIYCSNVENRLSEKFAKTLAKRYTDYIPSEDFKKQYNITEKMVLDVMRVLVECRRGPQYVVGDHILPYYQRGDIIVCDDHNGNPVDIKDMFPAKDFGLLRRPPNDFNWTVLVIAGRNAIIHGTDTPTAPSLSKIRDLKAIGYNAALVPWSLYTKLETNHDKATFLNDLIQNCIKQK